MYFYYLLFLFFFQPINSEQGLLTTVGYQLGKGKPVVYALEVFNISVLNHV
jgi:glycerol kinase